MSPPPIIEVASLDDPEAYDGPPVPAFVKRLLAREGGDRARLAVSLSEAIGEIDRRLRAQAQAILEHPEFRRLEAAWTSLEMTVAQKPPDDRACIVRVLNIARRELRDDLEDAIEFDRSTLFRLLYEEEYGTFGGSPYAVVVVDFDFTTSNEDVGVLRDLCGIAAAAHAVVFTGASPELVGIDSWTQLELGNLPETIPGAAWESLRRSDDARYLGLVMPRVLLREPLEPGRPGHWLGLREDGFARDGSGRVWGNAAFALGTLTMQAFHQHRWPVAIRGLEDGRGIVEGLPEESVGTDMPGRVVKPPIEVCVTESMEKGLVDLGLIPLCRVAGTHQLAFFGVPSLHQPRVVDDPAVAINLKLSSQLPYMLAASRVAHYIKVIMRDHVGSFTNVEAMRRKISDWLLNYTINDANATLERQAKYPLREYDVTIREKPGKPGEYEAITQLRPHFQLEDPNVSLRLAIDLPDPDKTRK